MMTMRVLSLIAVFFASSISLRLPAGGRMRVLGPLFIKPPVRTSTINARDSFYLMSTSGRGGSGGSTKLDRKTAQDTAIKPTYKEEIEKDWRLILHDDTVHTIQQVCDIVSQSCPLCTGPRAYEVTLQVHMTGAGTVAVANKKIITEYTKSLQAAGLTVSMAPDDDFEGGDGDEDG